MKRCWQTWVFATKRVLEFPFKDTNSKAIRFNVKLLRIKQLPHFAIGAFALVAQQPRQLLTALCKHQRWRYALKNIYDGGIYVMMKNVQQVHRGYKHVA